MKALIIGGTSGLGRELGLQLSNTYEVFVTGRHDPQESCLKFIPFDVDGSALLYHNVRNVMAQVGIIDLFIYCAGFYQDGTLDELERSDIEAVIQIGMTAPALLLQRILRIQEQLPGFIAVTSTSQTRPRLREPLYAATKAGLGMMANSVALDPSVNKTLVVAPAGLQTNFWKGGTREGDMLDPKWVAEQTLELFNRSFTYMHALILREPPRAEILEER